MTRLAIAAVLAVGGCGRISFDGLAGDVCDTPANHDEDGDGIDDACDPCPHIAGTLADMDGDGVGDACDPNPATPGDRIAFFDPFTSALPGWSFRNPSVPVYDGESIQMDGTGGSLLASRAVNGDPRGVIEIGLSLGAPADTTTQRQFLIAVGDIGNTNIQYCELNTTGTAPPELGIVRRTGGQYLAGHKLVLDGRLENQDAILHFDVRADGLACASTWPPSGQVDSEPLSSQPVIEVGYYGASVAAAFHYFIFIETP